MSYLMYTTRTLPHAYFNRSGGKGAFGFPGAMWDRFRCTVDPSPGHILCRNSCPLSLRQEKSTKTIFFGSRDRPVGWGSSTRRGGGRKVRALESLSSLGFEWRNPGCPGNFAGMSWTPGGVQKKFVLIFRSLISVCHRVKHYNIVYESIIRQSIVGFEM